MISNKSFVLKHAKYCKCDMCTLERFKKSPSRVTPKRMRIFNDITEMESIDSVDLSRLSEVTIDTSLSQLVDLMKL